MRSESELLDAALKVLQVANRATLDELLDEDLWDPMGCGCCAYTDSIPAHRYRPPEGEEPPRVGFVHDRDGVTWRVADGKWKKNET